MLGGGEEAVGAGDGGDEQMMGVGGEQHHQRQHRQEGGDRAARLRLQGIGGLGEGQGGLDRDHLPGHRQGRQEEAEEGAQHQSDQELVQHLAAHVPDRRGDGRKHLGSDGTQGERQHQGERQAHARRHEAFADPRDQHHHRAHPGEHEPGGVDLGR